MLSLQSNISYSKIDNLLLCYQSVENHFPKHFQHVLSCKNTAQFEKDIDWLYNQFSSQKNIVSKSIPFTLHFDGGYRSIYEIVFPILTKKGIPFQVNFSSDFINNHDLYYQLKLSLLIEKVENDFHLRKHFQKIRKHNDLKSHFLSLQKTDIKEINILLSMAEVDLSKYLKEHRPYLTSEELKTILNEGNKAGISLAGFEKLNIENINQYLDKEFLFHNRLGNMVSTLSLDPMEKTFSPELIEHILQKYQLEFYNNNGLMLDASNKVHNRLNLDNPQISADILVKSNFRKYSFQKLFGRNKVSS